MSESLNDASALSISRSQSTVLNAALISRSIRFEVFPGNQNKSDIFHLFEEMSVMCKKKMQFQESHIAENKPISQELSMNFEIGKFWHFLQKMPYQRRFEGLSKKLIRLLITYC